jgi:basic membrane lipoprotein Med (substrate-binding protein (PBP1-ABC) superfamily)
LRIGARRAPVPASLVALVALRCGNGYSIAMIGKFARLDRRQFLNLGAATGASLLLESRLAAAPTAGKPLPPVAEESALIAFGHVGPVADEAWTWSHDQGMKAVQAAFPKLKTVMVESVPFSADASRIFRRFVGEGANMVFATSNYGDFLYDVARRAPDVAFFECDGRNPLANLGTYYVAHWYPSYVAGVAAGLMSKSGKLGYVASFPVPSVYSGANAFLMGARTANPAASMQVIAINKWFDPQASTQAASALIDNGADLLFGIMDEAGYLQVADKRGAKAVMWGTDLRRYGPRAYVTSIVIDFRKFYVDQVRARLAGTWTPPTILLPLAGGVDVDAWGDTVPDEARKRAAAVRARLMSGWSPFVGPLKDAKGTLRVAAGKNMTEAELYNWDWPIEGVVGIG